MTKKKIKEKPLSKIEKKRVEILQDALAQIKAEKYKVTQGEYIGGNFERSIKNLREAADVINGLPDEQKKAFRC